MNKKLFAETCYHIIHNDIERCGIGTMKEKTLHAVLKNYFEPDSDYQEIRYLGCIADIMKDNNIIEIQTRSFNALRTKLDRFLEHNKVTIVYPIPHTKWLCWIDEETGEISKKRKSPKKGTIYQAFPELYKIKNFLPHMNLSLCIVFLDIEEHRLLNGWSHDKKKGSTRYDRLPVDIIDEVTIDTIDDFKKMIPNDLPETFTSKDFKKQTGLNLSVSQTALNILHYIGVVERVGKSGNTFLYKVNS